MEEKKTKGEAFECRICLEPPVEPVVTKCGHLFCWSCIHTWITTHTESQVCPVCKAGVTVESLIPIYSGSGGTDPRKNAENIPKRPQAERMDPPPSGPTGGNFGFSFGLGAFPGLFFSWNNFTGMQHQHYQGHGMPRENREAYKYLVIFFVIISVLSFFLTPRYEVVFI